MQLTEGVRFSNVCDEKSIFHINRSIIRDSLCQVERARAAISADLVAQSDDRLSKVEAEMQAMVEAAEQQLLQAKLDMQQRMALLQLDVSRQVKAQAWSDLKILRLQSKVDQAEMRLADANKHKGSRSQDGNYSVVQ